MQNVNQREEKLYIQTFREIRKYIIRNKLQPGDMLPTEQEMCQRLGVSRNVLREAIKAMELMGMVQACSGKGTMVRPFNLDFVFHNVLFFTVGDGDRAAEEMFGVRRMLELAYMRPAFQAMGEEDVKRIRELADAISQRWSEGEIFAAEDREFHLTLFKALDNSVLNSMLEAIWAVDTGFGLEERMSHMAQSVENHQEIARALEDYNYRAFAKAMEAHFSTGKYLNAGETSPV